LDSGMTAVYASCVVCRTGSCTFWVVVTGLGTRYCVSWYVVVSGCGLGARMVPTVGSRFDLFFVELHDTPMQSANAKRSVNRNILLSISYKSTSNNSLSGSD